MVVLFTDINGVLTHAGSAQPDFHEPMSSSFFWAAQYDSACVARLRRIIDATDATVVVTSDSRKYNYQIMGLTRALIATGLSSRTARAISGSQTPILGQRAQEISAWLVTHPDVSKYVVLDDEWVEGHPLVQTSNTQGGLQDEHVNQVIQILLA